MPEQVRYEEIGTTGGQVLGVATLDAPQSLNSLTLEMVDSLLDRLGAWQDDERVVAVILQAAGEKAFCAGGDVQALYKSATERPGGPCSYAETFFEREYRLDYLLHRYRKPVVCLGHGIVMGGGLGLFAGCSHRLVTERTRIAMPEITIALYPDVGGTWFLNRMPGKTGLFVALTAAPMNAADALYTGMADDYLPSGRIAAFKDALAVADWQSANSADVVQRAIASAAAGAQPEAPSTIAAYRDLIDRLCDVADLQAVYDNILGDDTADDWFRRGRAALSAGSPIGAHTIWEQLRRGRDLGLAEVFRFELMVSTNVVRYPEFAEGVRALLIDKDKNPAWQYATIGDVPRELVEQLFTPPWPENPLADLE